MQQNKMRSHNVKPSTNSFLSVMMWGMQFEPEHGFLEWKLRFVDSSFGRHAQVIDQPNGLFGIVVTFPQPYSDTGGFCWIILSSWLKFGQSARSDLLDWCRSHQSEERTRHSNSSRCEFGERDRLVGGIFLFAFCNIESVLTWRTRKSLAWTFGTTRRASG